MKDIKKAAALIASAVATTAVPVQAADTVECKVGKQKYVFEKNAGKKLSAKQAISQRGRHKDSYTEVEWTYLLKVAPEVARKDAIKCGSLAFLKLGDVNFLKDSEIKLNAWQMTKDEL